jgi:hypothetical protein
MNGDAGGWLWLLIDVGFVIVLAGALTYGLMMWRKQQRTQTPEQRRQREQATRELYRAEDRS